MDLYIEKENQTVRMSSLGILVQDIKVSNATLELNRKKINGKNGNLFFGASHTEKKITVIGKYHVQNLLQDELMKDQLNGFFADTKPYYITKMYNNDNLYDYERPGESSGFDLIQADKQRKYRYRYNVLLEGEIDYSFQGFSDAGLLYEVTFTFTTADIPFGVTVPENIDLTGKDRILYQGTAPCSQLEWPFSLKIELTQSYTGSCSFTIGKRTILYSDSSRTLNAGDILMFNGVSTTLNEVNVNDKTNYNYFVLEPDLRGYIDYSYNVPSKATLLNLVEFYR
ncbi:MAG: phage tail domain-containing protein [Enterococcus sp.]